MFAFVQQVFHHLGIVEANIFQRFANLGHGQLDSLLESGVEKQIVSDRSRFGSPPCHGLVKGLQFLSHKEKNRPESQAKKFCRVKRRQNKSGVLGGGKIFHGE